MAELLKDMYSKAFFNKLTNIFSVTVPSFNAQLFMERIYDGEWENRALKQRMKHIAITLKHFLPVEYGKAISIIKDSIQYMRRQGIRENGIEYMFFPEFIEMFGIHDYKTSVMAIEYVTQFTSCEYAVRPFIIQHQDKMMKQMLVWSKHTSHLVRRLASEGCRPRLPWAVALPALKQDPSAILPILENLKDDESEFVRRSVANNLNDIAKDHPKVVMQTAEKWKGYSDNTDWVIRHGCRTLLKKAHGETLSFFGLADTQDQVSVTVPVLEKDIIAIGDDLRFAFKLKVRHQQPVKLRIEYGIDYMKANGKPNRKIFKLAENVYPPGKGVAFRRYQSFKDLTTRRHYAGKHRICIIINGQEKALTEFNVVQPMVRKTTEYTAPLSTAV
ncbi:DNA alkylation repair protein [Foetidibacter luteolus]|uniref:DNA alkylation repair protein n=1 Tax=Foetidibacter luteolus TaxID=2608880 RepID=UPI00129AD5C0|nr:DNA alkylation repair protein [Foetidibacter luteolus]